MVRGDDLIAYRELGREGEGEQGVKTLFFSSHQRSPGRLSGRQPERLLMGPYRCVMRAGAG